MLFHGLLIWFYAKYLFSGGGEVTGIQIYSKELHDMWNLYRLDFVKSDSPRMKCPDFTLRGHVVQIHHVLFLWERFPPLGRNGGSGSEMDIYCKSNSYANDTKYGTLPANILMSPLLCLGVAPYGANNSLYLSWSVLSTPSMASRGCYWSSVTLLSLSTCIQLLMFFWLFSALKC